MKWPVPLMVLVGVLCAGPTLALEPILKDLGPSGDRYKGGTIIDPEDGKVYKSELWLEDGNLKMRGYLGVFYKTQTWVKGQ